MSENHTRGKRLMTQKSCSAVKTVITSEVVLVVIIIFLFSLLSKSIHRDSVAFFGADFVFDGVYIQECLAFFSWPL